MSQPAATPHQLLRILGLGFGLAVVIGSTVGVGILKAPGQLAGELGSAPLALAVWAAVGAYALLGTSIIAEVATLVPKAGGWSAYADRAFGGAAGFAIGWVNWLMLLSTTSTLAVAIGELLGQLAPALAPRATAVSIAALLGFGALHWTGTRSSGRVQEVTSAVKALAFLGLVAACFLHDGRADAALAPAVPRGVALLLGLVAAAQIVIFAFDGWYGAIYFAEEDEDPGRNLPRAMMYGTLGVIALYLLVNAALWRALPPGEMAAAAAKGDIAAVAAARALFGPAGGAAILLVALVAVPSVLNATLLQGTRVLYSLGRAGHTWRGFAAVNARGTPARALLASTAVAIALIAGARGAFDTLLAVTTLYYAIVYASGFLAMWSLRRREPGAARPYRAMLHPWSTMYVLAVSGLFLAGAIYADPVNSLWAALLIALAVPIHRAVASASRAPDRLR